MVVPGPARFRKREGQSAVELLVALAIFVLVIGAFAALVFGGRSLTTGGGEASRALARARGNLERAGAAARDNFAGLVSASSTVDGLLEEVIVEVIEPNTKRVISRVTWDTNPLRPESIELAGLFTNAKGVKDTGGDTGGGATSGDWQNPKTFGSIDLGSGISATDLDVFQKIMYLSTEASDKKKNDFFVVDTTDGQNPVIRSEIDLGEGLNAIDVASTTAYVASDDTTDQLKIISVADPATSTLVSTFNLPGVSGAGAVGWSVLYSGGKVYIGTKRASGPEFHVVDVSNPAAPLSLGSFEVNADVNAIQVNGRFAYLATSDDAAEMKILEIADPASIAAAGAYNAAGAGDGLSLWLYGNILYLGREGGSPQFAILDVSSPASITLLGAATINADVLGVRVRDNLAFLGTSDANSEFQVWDVSNPAAIVFWSSFNFPQVVTGIDYEDNLVYVAVRSNDALRLITSGP